MSLLKQNYFQFPNVFADDLMKHLTPTQFLCLVTIIRKTVGWNKQIDSISLSQFMEMTGIRSKTTVMRALKVLENVDLVAVQRQERITTIYELGPIFYNNNCTRAAITKIVIDLVAQNTPDSKIPIPLNAPTKDSSLNTKEREKRRKPAQVKSKKEKRAHGAQLKAGDVTVADRQEISAHSTEGINPHMAEIFEKLHEACKR